MPIPSHELKVVLGVIVKATRESVIVEVITQLKWSILGERCLFAVTPGRGVETVASTKYEHESTYKFGREMKFEFLFKHRGEGVVTECG